MTADNTFERTADAVGRVWPRRAVSGRPINSSVDEVLTYAAANGRYAKEWK